MAADAPAFDAAGVEEPEEERYREQVAEAFRSSPKPSAPCTYDVEEVAYWESRHLPSGSVIAFDMDPHAEPDAETMAVLVKTTEDNKHGTWADVKFLGARTAEASEQGRRIFRSKQKRIHICRVKQMVDGQVECPIIHEDGTHLRRFRWYPPGDFANDWLSAAARRAVRGGIKMQQEQAAAKEAEFAAKKADAAPTKSKVEERLAALRRRAGGTPRVSFGDATVVQDGGGIIDDDPENSGDGPIGSVGPSGSARAKAIAKQSQGTLAITDGPGDTGKRAKAKKLEEELAEAASSNQRAGRSRKRSRSRSRRRKKKKKKKKKDGSDDSPSSSGSSSSSSSRSLMAPLKKRSERAPGSVYRMLEEQALNQLARDGVMEEEMPEGQRPRLYTYYQLSLKPHVDPRSRDAKEMGMLARALDLLRAGRLTALADLLAARLIAVETATRQGWNTARHLEIFAPDEEATAPPHILLAAQRHAQQVDRAGGKGSWGKISTWQKGDWSGGRVLDEVTTLAVEELILAAARGTEPSLERAPSFEAAGRDRADCDTRPNSMQESFKPRADAGSKDPCIPSNATEWLRSLGDVATLKQLGVRLAWGWKQGFLQTLLKRAGPSQATAAPKAGGLFPLPVPDPGYIDWQLCHGQPTSCLGWAAACWVTVVSAALNWYYGFPGYDDAVSRKRVHAAVYDDLKSKITRMLIGDHDVNFNFEEVIADLKTKKISYTGEEVSQPLPLSCEQIVGGLPPVGHGGSIDVVKFLRGRTRYLILNPEENLVPPSERPEAPIQSKVHIRKGDELKVFELLQSRGIIDWVPADSAYTDTRGTYLNGLFGVVKPKRFTLTNLPVLRVIMNLVPSNALFADIKGDIASLPNATAWMSLTLSEGEQLFLSQGDMQSAFYLFRMPPQWRQYFCFNYCVKGSEIGLAPNSWFRPSCSVLPMGWCASVGIMQMVAREVLLVHQLPYQLELKKTSALPAWFTKVTGACGATAWWQVYLDNFLAGEKTDLGSAGLAVSLQDDAMAAWDAEAILNAKDKNVVASQEVTELGVRIDGQWGLIGASCERVVKTVLASIHMLLHPRWDKKLAQIVLGRWVFILQFRRAGMAVLSRSWESVEARWPSRNQIHRLHNELLGLICLAPILQCDLTATYDEVVTCSDASERGGAAALASSLTEAGERFSNLMSQPPLQAVELPILVISLFNGIGGAFRLYDILGIRVMGKISVDICKEANRTTRTTWGDVIELHDILDINEAEVRRWANEFPRAEEVHLYAGFPCVHLSSVRAYRMNLYGEGSNLFWRLLDVIALVHRFFGDHCRVKQCIENVASMDDKARKQISNELQTQPIKLDPCDTLPFNRPRLAWSSVEIPSGPGYELWREKEYVRLYVTEGAVEDSQWVRPGWSRRDPSAKLPTFMKAIPRSQPPPVPVGLHRASEPTINRWVEHEYRFPPYQYADRYLFDHPNKQSRLADSSERELLLGYGAGHTESARAASGIKKNKQDFEDIRMTLCGDSFAISSFAIIAAAMCRQFLAPMSPQQIINRLGLAPGSSAHPSFEVPLQRVATYGAPPGLPATRLQLVKQLGLTVNHTGADVRLVTGEAMGRKSATHSSVAPYLEAHPDPQTYDSLISDWIEYQWARGEALTIIADSLSGLHFYWPELKGTLRHSWRMFRNWRRVEAPARAPPITPLIVAAMIVRAVHRDELAFGVLLAVGFHGLLRTGELLSLQFQDIEFTSQCGVISLKSSKSGLRTGAEEAIAVRDPLTLQLLHTLRAIRSPSAGDKLWPHSGQSFRNTFQRYLQMFQLEGLAFKPYSLRRGGATFLLQCGLPMETILVRGRWRSLNVTGSMVAFAKLQGLVGGNAAVPGGNVGEAQEWNANGSAGDVVRPIDRCCPAHWQLPVLQAAVLQVLGVCLYAFLDPSVLPGLELETLLAGTAAAAGLGLVVTSQAPTVGQRDVTGGAGPSGLGSTCGKTCG
eukprot:Skav231044  [mRNA]  locus=scaffold446:243817:254709:+ [translate_table: standard]